MHFDPEPHFQRFELDDRPQRYGLYQVEFTDEELKSQDQFCKGILFTVEGKFSIY